MYAPYKSFIEIDYDLNVVCTGLKDTIGYYEDPLDMDRGINPTCPEHIKQKKLTRW